MILVGSTCKRGKARKGGRRRGIEKEEEEEKKNRVKGRGKKKRKKTSKVDGGEKSQALVAITKNLSYLPNLQSLGMSKGSHASAEDQGV